MRRRYLVAAAAVMLAASGLALAALKVLAPVLDRVECWRVGHDVAHHPLGYFFCKRCPMKAADLAAFGTLDEGYVRRRR